MTITLAVFFYFFLAVLIFFLLYSLFNIYHLLRFGFMSWANVSAMLVYLIMAAALLFLAFNLLAPIDWSEPLLIIDYSPF